MKASEHYSNVVLFIMLYNGLLTFIPCLFSCTAVVGTPDVGEEMTEEVDTYVSEQEESSCSRLLAAAAERVWDIFVQNKREVGYEEGGICVHQRELYKG